MADPELDLEHPPTDAQAPTRRALRDANSIEPAAERARRGPSPRAVETSPELGEGLSKRPGDVPESLTRRYFTEALRGGSVLAYYEGPGAKRPAFHDHGARLSTDQTNPAVVRDLAAIAAHRGWTSIRVRGSDDFRREVWMEARALGLEVKGYTPRDRDRQELAQRVDREANAASSSTTRSRRDKARTQGEDTRAKAPAKDRPDYAAGVSGVLLASGEAPYRRRFGEPVTPFIRLDRGVGAPLDIWGVGLPDALKRSGAEVGDAVRVRRDGMDVVQRTISVRDPKTGAVNAQLRDVSRNRWVIEADRFRETSPGQAARDPDLRGPQSHLAVLNAVIDRAIPDPALRSKLRSEARDIVADEIAQGRRFTPARVRDIEPALAHDIANARSQDAAHERARRR